MFIAEAGVHRGGDAPPDRRGHAGGPSIRRGSRRRRDDHMDCAAFCSTRTDADNVALRLARTVTVLLARFRPVKDARPHCS
jgi:hypothetical protein